MSTDINELKVGQDYLFDYPFVAYNESIYDFWTSKVKLVYVPGISPEIEMYSILYTSIDYVIGSEVLLKNKYKVKGPYDIILNFKEVKRHEY